jgi:hypothetical protein
LAFAFQGLRTIAIIGTAGKFNAFSAVWAGPSRKTAKRFDGERISRLFVLDSFVLVFF